MSTRKNRWGSRKRGEIIAERYRLDKVLGVGGMGTVYRATHLTLHTPVAIKMMHETFSREEKYRKRFTREARVTSLLKHKNAVQIFDFGEYEGSLYLVMEYLSGKPLRQMIRRSSLPSIEQIVDYGIQLADALEAAHELRLVHRDLKPDNIMIEQNVEGVERVVVVDFGLAFMEATPSELGRLTTVGLISGTPQYMAPEQARGVDVGPAADIYATGCILFEMASGMAPFKGRSAMDILNQHMFVAPPSILEIAPRRQVPPRLDTLIAQCLRKEQEERPTAVELQTKLRNLREGSYEEVEPMRGDRVLTPRMARATPTRTATHPERRVRYVDRDEQRGLVTITDSWGEAHPMRIALSANGYHCTTTSGTSIPDGAEVVVAPRADTDLVQALVQHGAPVLVTAHAGDMDQVAALLKLGVAEVILEPVRTEELLRKVGRTLRKVRRSHT